MIGALPRFLLRFFRQVPRWLALSAMALAAASCGDDTPTQPTPPPAAPALSLQCPANVEGQSATGAPVALQVPPPTASGGVAPISVACVPAATSFPVGSTPVTCTATDARTTRATCSYSVRVAPPPLSRTTYLAFGDSMTAGEITVPVGNALDANGFQPFRLVLVPAQSYPSELAGMLRTRYFTQAAQFVVTNAGVPREWAGDGPRRFPQAFAAAGNPQVVLLMEGANDLSALGSRGISQALGGLQAMTRAARAGGAAVFVASIPPSRPGGNNTLPPALVAELNAAIRLGAASEGAIFVDVHAALASTVELDIGVDGLHPTEAGYRRIAETFFAAIRAAFEGR